MASDMSERAVCIAAWGAQRLQNTGPCYPRSRESAVKAMSPQSGSVVSYCEPTDMLEIVGRLAVDRKGTLTVPMYSIEQDTVDIQNLTCRLWNVCCRRAQSRNMVLVHCPKSDKELQIQQSIMAWMKESSTSFKTLSSEQFIQKLCNVYMEAATQSSIDITEEAIKNLCLVKYMTVDEKSGVVGYSFPSDFNSLCIHQVVTKTQKWWNTTFSCKEQPPFDTFTTFPNFFHRVLDSTNSSLSSLRENLKKDSNTMVEREMFTAAVKSLNKVSKHGDNRGTTQLAYRKKRAQQKPKPKPVSLSPKDIANATDQLTSNILDDLCKEVSKLSVDDIDHIPDGLSFEAAVVMLKLSNMGKQKPKTVDKLRNALKVTCQFLCFAPLWNVKAVGKNCPPKAKRPVRTSRLTKERQLIKLKKKGVQGCVSLEPDTFLEDVKTKKMSKKADISNKMNQARSEIRPGDKRKLSSNSESSQKQDSNVEAANRLSSFRKSLTSRADTIAQKLSTFTIPANEETKMEAIGKVREVIASRQRHVEPMETNGDCENRIPVGLTKAELLEDLIKACIKVEQFPKEETIKAVADAGVISLPASEPMKISDNIQDKVEELQDKKEELQKRHEPAKKEDDDDQNGGMKQNNEDIENENQEIENTSSTFHQTVHYSTDKYAFNSIKSPLVWGAIISVVVAVIYVSISVFYN